MLFKIIFDGYFFGLTLTKALSNRFRWNNYILSSSYWAFNHEKVNTSHFPEDVKILFTFPPHEQILNLQGFFDSEHSVNGRRLVRQICFCKACMSYVNYLFDVEVKKERRNGV